MKKIIFIIFFFFFSLSIVYSDEQQDKKTKIVSFYWQARYFINTKEEKKAEDLLKKIIEIDNSFADAYFSLYELYLQQDKLEDAFIYLNKLKTLNYKDTSITYELKIFNIQEALKDLKKKIDEQKKIKLPKREKKKKTSWLKRLISDKPTRKKDETVKNIIPAKVIYKGINKIEIYKGYLDNLKANTEIYLFSNNKIIGRARLTEVKQFISFGEIIEFENKEILKENEIIANGIEIY